MSSDEPGAGHRWLAIDAAAKALGVSIPTAYRYAIRHRWRHDHGRPRGYLLADIRTTAHTRRKKSL